MFLRVVELFLFLILMWMVIFQIGLPAITKNKLFPAFRWSRQAIEKKIIARKEKIDQQKLKDELNSLK